ncbi:hypothetical protein Tco_1487924 [Tanacetum coccineum]
MSKEVGTPRYLSLVVPLKKVGDEAVHKELGDRMERATTTASSLEAEQDSGSGPRCQDTILGDVNAQTRFEITSKQSNDPPLSRGYTLGSGEDSMKLLELMEFCTQLSYKNRKSVLAYVNAYFDSPTKDVHNGEPKTADNAQKQVEDGPNNENAEQERFADDSSTKDVNSAGQHVNTASLDVNTGSLKLNAVGPSVNTASSNEHDSPEDMFTMGVSSTLEAAHIFFR